MTHLIVAKVMLKRPKVQFECYMDGNIEFKLHFAKIGMPHFDLLSAKLLHTQWFANAIGEFLVRLNIDQLDAVVGQADYPVLVQQKNHTGFGLRFHPHYLQFKFHCSLLNRLFNERIRWELRGVRA